MEPFQIAYAAVIAGPNGFEQTIPFIYLDTHTPPLPTVGVGCATNLDEVRTLRWTIDGTGVIATDAQVVAGFLKVSGMKSGMRAQAYRYPGCLILPDDQQMVLLQKRFDAATKLLRAMFPAFDSYPECAKAGLLEMPFTLGLRGFQVSYPMFRAAVARAGDAGRSATDRFHDWIIASQECVRNAGNPAYTRRNVWTQEQFQKAAAMAGQSSI